MSDEYMLRLEASGEVTPAKPDELRAAQAYARAFNTPPSAGAATYIRDRLAVQRNETTEPEEAEQ